MQHQTDTDARRQRQLTLASVQMQAYNGGAKVFNNSDTPAALYTRPGQSGFDRSAFNVLSNGIFVHALSPPSERAID